MILDWIECTFLKDRVGTLTRLEEYFRPWQEVKAGGMGYDKSALVWETGRIFWSTTRYEMGVHVRLPASALQISGRDPVTILCDFYRMGAKFTRLDIAADDVTGRLDMETMREKVLSREMVVRVRHFEERRILLGAGYTLMFGARESESYMRIYDKAAEQNAKGKKYVGHWIRAELELKRVRAQAAAKYIFENQATWRDAACGWFRAFLDFKEPGTDKNKSRWETCEWWLAFLENAAKLRLFISKIVRTVDDILNWVEHQVAPSLFVLSMTIGHDELFERIGKASSRLSPRHMEMIHMYGQVLGLAG